jgi:hypothetical protein
LNVPDTEQMITWTGEVDSATDLNDANDRTTAATEVTAAPVEVDLVAVNLGAPPTVQRQTAFNVTFTVNNPDAGAVDADVQICGTGSSGYSDCFNATPALAPGNNDIVGSFVAPWALQTINWTATVSAPIDPNPANDTRTASTRVARW